MDRTAPAAVQTPFDHLELGVHVRAQMGTQLCKMYAEVVGEGVPARFVEILRRLDERPPEDGDRKV
jgi:hypothetical protein